MKEQVKEWIVDKNLTTDSFDSIMIGVIYNSGHNTLDDPDVRKWIEMHPGEFREMLPLNLNENQQVVLEWLKDKYSITDIEPIELFWRLHVNTKNRFKTLVVFRAYKYLTRKAQLEVLQVFSQWALEQGEE